MTFFRVKNEEEKIEYINGRADYDIVFWNQDVLNETRKYALTYMIWKAMAEQKFERKMDVGEVYKNQMRRR
jgi:hypothetical protein